MPVLYVTQPGAQVRHKGGRLRVEWQGQVLAALPLREVERLVLLGPVQLSAAATRILLRAHTPVIFCNLRGHCYGTLSTGCEDVELLLAQLAFYRDEASRLGIARAIVGAKIKHQQGLLRRHARNHPDPTLIQAADQLKSLLESLSGCSSVPQVMGIEGQGSAIYFSAFGRCLHREGVAFPGRNRRPPKDPVNALLSLGYMLVLGEVLGAIMAQGLHPGLGFLHEPSRRRPALALDLLEVARQPIVDRLTLSLFNKGVLTPDDFQAHPGGAVRLREQSLKRYLQFYERTMTTPFRYGTAGSGPQKAGTFRDWLRSQVEALREALQENDPWAPIVLEL
jgi:CRISPR-associated protein Cas1